MQPALQQPSQPTLIIVDKPFQEKYNFHCAHCTVQYVHCIMYHSIVSESSQIQIPILKEKNLENLYTVTDYHGNSRYRFCNTIYKPILRSYIRPIKKTQLRAAPAP